MTASCPGFAQYQILSNGQVEVNGSIPTFTSQVRLDPLLEAWERFGADISGAAAQHGIPAAWLVGIMMAETKGNPNACSPCSICSASICASGAGMRCCAFGLMQFIASTALAYGTTPTELVQSPGVAIDAAARLLTDMAGRFGMDLPKLAAAYNSGGNRCGKSGTTFGWNTNGDYPMVVVQYANTFVDLNLPTPARSTKLAGTLLAVVGAGIAYAIYTGKL